mmetsp:Transcript_10649/g.44027  ORF Transcript_10649/g.44027 Transcript_10649/m.44027 type:complete len:727 (-) Transcript_10649:176-2356(-)
MRAQRTAHRHHALEMRAHPCLLKHLARSRCIDLLVELGETRHQLPATTGRWTTPLANDEHAVLAHDQRAHAHVRAGGGRERVDLALGQPARHHDKVALSVVEGEGALSGDRHERGVLEANAKPRTAHSLALPRAQASVERRAEGRSVGSQRACSGYIHRHAAIRVGCRWQLGALRWCSRLSCSTCAHRRHRNHAAAAAAAADGSKAADTGSEGAIEAMLDATGVEPRDSFEVAYNVACAALACGDVARAEEMLNLALKVGRAALELDDAGEDEISEELAPAEVQLAYIAQLGGGAEEAAKAYTSVLDGGADAVTTAVAANNLAAARGKHEVFDSLKRFAGLFGPKKSASEANAIVASLDTRLGPAQRRALMRTRALLLLHAGKSELAGRAADAYGSAFPDDAAAAILAASRPGVSPGVADDMLSSYAGGQRGPAAAAAAHCARAELAARAGLLEEAAAALEAVAELIKLTPPVVATLLDVYGRLDDAERSAATLERALSPGGGGGDMALPAELLRGAAERRQVEGRHAEAAELWQRCEARAARGDEGDDTLARLARAGAVECLASSGQVGAAEELASGLAPVPGAEKLNPEALLSAPVRERADAGKVGSTALEGGESAGCSGEAEQPRKRRVMSERRKERKRLRRLPKGFDPANPGPPPDPERWLPKRERSTFRRKRNKKVTGGQGAVNVESMGKLDAATQEAAKTQQAPSRGSGKKGRKQKGGRR